MAVPKKRTSKTKKNIRKNAWKRKILNKVNKAFTLAKMIYKEEEKQKSDLD
uniref:Large ribosomal subunit protein bL32c n=1 Tax=Oedogonium capilliforme TaxID=2831087 RepID=A0A8E5I4V6_9CHLO|nr:ribosomal protein L32 [Oedogonium capilliforme]